MLAAVALTVVGCGDTTPASSSAATSSTTAPAEGNTAPSGFGDAFKAAHGSAPWYSAVSAAELSGQAVIVRTTLEKDQGADAVPICDAAREVATKMGVDFVSVTVRSSRDYSIAAFNKLRNQSACAAV
ncbi:MAG TPA: hypothetical protein VM677_27855 [Actinokineospora sp.]|nr:hypothetical protein [Actinokineospora sp.]